MFVNLNDTEKTTIGKKKKSQKVFLVFNDAEFVENKPTNGDGVWYAEASWALSRVDMVAIKGQIPDGFMEVIKRQKIQIVPFDERAEAVLAEAEERRKREVNSHLTYSEDREYHGVYSSGRG